MATTFEPDASVSSVGLSVDDVGNFNIARVDGRWLLQGGPRADFQNSNVRGDTFGEVYDLMLEYAQAIKDGETALATEIAAILPPPP